VRLSLVNRGGTLPKRIKFRVFCLEQCSPWGNGMLLAAGREDGDGLLGTPTKPSRPGGEGRRLEDARGRQPAKLMEETLKAKLQCSLLC